MEVKMKQFSARMFHKGTWVISGEGCDCYLLEGEHEAIMIDTGESRDNIQEFAQTLTKKPLCKAVNTHSHFDHTGGNGFFDTIYATKGIAGSAKNTMGADPASYPLNYEFTFIEDGDILNPGERPLQVIMLGCHSPEDIVILDIRNRILFSGDEVESGQVLLLPGYAERPGQIHAVPAATVEAYLIAVKRLRAMESAFDSICPGHNGTPIDNSYLDWLIILCEKILNGEIVGSAECSSPSYDQRDTHFPYPNAGYRRAEYQGAALVYCGELLRNADIAEAGKLPPATPLHLISSYYAYRK
jgi:glyoxylase-like metal-dependent hydrolase (beta-lactamase superfamily II)